MMQCFLESISVLFCLALLPQRIKTICFFCVLMVRMTASVNSSHPLSLCELGCCFRTVSTVFRSKTPCFAHAVRLPLCGGESLRSFSRSMNIFFKEGGWGTPSETENDSPFACPYPWQGSCPRMSTRTESKGVCWNAEKIWFPGGRIVCCYFSSRRNALRACMNGCWNVPQSTLSQDSSICGFRILILLFCM